MYIAVHGALVVLYKLLCLGLVIIMKCSCPFVAI